jgi:uncharacterized protein YbjT (DUF2867 family)
VVTRGVFITGGTGYVGSRVATALRARGHRVRVLSRAASAHRVPQGVETVLGDALEAASFRPFVRADDTFVHLVGTPHPSPAKAAEFRRVDLPSIHAAVTAAAAAGVAHFVYVSVAQPAPIMRAYIAVRQEGESAIGRAGLTATVLRPWYVLGPVDATLRRGSAGAGVATGRGTTRARDHRRDGARADLGRRASVSAG